MPNDWATPSRDGRRDDEGESARVATIRQRTEKNQTRQAGRKAESENGRGETGEVMAEVAHCGTAEKVGELLASDYGRCQGYRLCAFLPAVGAHAKKKNRERTALLCSGGAPGSSNWQRPVRR